MIQYCDANGFLIDKVFREEGESAKSTDRTQLQSMLTYLAKCAKKEGITHLVISRVDRLSRQAGDYALLRASMARAGVTVVSVHENFDNSPAGRLNENLLASFAQFDNDVRSEKTTAGMKAAIAKGYWVWKPPVGYKRGVTPNHRELIRDDPAANFVIEAFERVASGEVPAHVHRSLVDAGMTAKGSKRLSKKTFHKMLRNPIYVGKIVVGPWDIDTTGVHEALISQELFDRVQGILNPGKVSPKQRQTMSPDFPLRNYAQCGSCGTPLTASWSRGNGGKFGYYRCYNRMCGKTSVRKEIIETAFVEVLSEMTLSSNQLQLLEKVVRATWASRFGALEKDEQRLRSKLDSLVQKSDAILDAYVEGVIDAETYQAREAKLKTEINSVRLQLASLPRLNFDVEEVLVFAKKLLADLPGYWNHLEPMQRPSFVRAFMPTGVSYANGVVRTNETPWFVTSISGATTSMSTLAVPTGFEPVPIP